MALLPRHPLLVALAALTVGVGASAQAPVALNAPALAAEAPRAGSRGDNAAPDTTAPWRYFPLHVGDAWEYYRYQDGAIERRVVTGTEMHGGREYFRVDFYHAHGGPPTLTEYRLPRFDTLSSRAKEFGVGTGQERDYLYAGCPFDAAFGSTVTCYFPPGPTAVSGGYDGRLVFGGSLPGTGTDTVTVAYKRFDALAVDLEHRFAAGFGFAYSFNGKGGEEWGITFARVNGVVHGLERFPGVGTAADPVPAPPGAFTLAVHPNPARGSTRASFSLPEPGSVALEVVDALGRRVLARDLGALPAGRHEAVLDLAALTPGVYAVRLQTGGGPAASRPLTVAR